MKNNLLFSQTTALGKTLGKRLVMVLTMLLIVGIEQAWGETIVSWSGAKREANTEYDPTTSQTDNSTAKLKSECTLSTAGTSGSAGSYYGTWTNDKCIYVTGLNLSNYKDISLTVYLRRRNPTCTASFFTSTDGSTYAATALTTKTLSNTLTSYTVTGIQSNVKSIKILITGGSGNLWLGTLSFEGTKATATPIDVTLHYKGIEETLSNKPSPYTLPTTGDYVGDACDGWEFAGWYGSEYAKSETEPTFLSQLTSSGDAYAVYSHTETTGGGTSTNTTTDNIFSNGTFANNIITWTLSNVVSIKQERNGNSNSAVADYTDAPRWYKGHKITITPSVDITKITVVAQSGYADELVNATFTNATASYSSNTVTITPVNGRDPITIVMGAQARLSTLTVTYSGGGSSSTTYYSTTPECSTQTSISLYPNFGSELPTVITTGASTYEVPPCSFTRTGYTFSHWDTKDDDLGVDYEPGDNINLNGTDINLYAIWEPNEYEIIYKDQGGADFSGTHAKDHPTQHTYGSVTELKNPTKASFNFIGWYTTSACDGDPITELGATDYTQNITLYAKWEVAKTATSLSWSAATYSATIDADNTFPTLTIDPEAIKESVQYTSSDETIATIDANGNITLLKKGETTITATFTETNTHAGATDSYTLTVHPSNCRWVETEIGDIDSGDEVVITMTTVSGVTYALPSEKFTSGAPNATPVKLDGKSLESIIPQIVWIIYKNGDNLTFESNYNQGNYLAFTNSDTGVRVNDNTNRNFVVDDVSGYLMNTQTNDARYLGVHNKDFTWYSYKTYSVNTGAQTLKFYKKVCLDSENYWVEGSLTNVTCTQTLPQQIAKSETLALNFEAATGFALPDNVTVTGATPSWNKATGTLTISNPTDNVMITVEAVELHTITWMVGSNSVLTEKVANATGVTQTPPNPANNAIGNCADAFVGWSETLLGSADGQNAPADLCNATQMKSKHTSVTGDKTFHAVFASAEGGNDYVQISSENDLEAGSKYLIVGNSSYTHKALPVDKATSLTNVSPSSSKISNPADELIWTLEGTADQWKIKSTSNNKYLQINQSNLSFVNSTTLTFAVTVSSSKFTFTSSASSGNKILSYYHNGNCFNAYNSANTVHIYKQDVSYSNYVTSCCETPAPTNGTFDNVTGSGNTMSLTLNWEGSAARYHITGGNLAAEGIYTSETSYTVNNLTECEEYIFNITAYPKDGCESAAILISAQPFSGAKTVNYDYNGGSGSVASFTTSCDDDKREIILPAATRLGYTFEGWYDSEENKVGDAGATYDPATSPITLYAHWTENTYQLNHSGSNYTITENQTSIKSSETPFTLHYTCTGDYGLPATISITGGGKSWTVNTDYTWEVAADKQSATLVIKETVISDHVTITINVATRYTVTFVHHDKGVFDGESTIEVLSSENTITLPTVEDVSCGFYDTFEGWVISNDEYVESTIKPATVYAGGASYKVTGDCTFRALYSKCEGDNKEVYVKVIENLDDWSGTYLIVNETNNVVMDGSKTTETGLIAQNNCQNITINNNQIESNNQNDTYTFTIAPHTTTNGKYSIKSYSGYYIGSNSASNTINATTTESTYSNSITITDGILTIGCGKYKDSDASKEYRLMYMHSGSGAPVFKYYPNTQGQVCLYKKGTLCTKYYSTNPSCEKPVGVHIVYNANAADANMSCSTQERKYKIENEVNKYPQLASQLQFCTNATREGYTLVGWNTQENGQGTTYNINQNYYNLPVSGELDGAKWITLNLYAMWKPCIKFNLGNTIGGTGVPDVVVENGECILPEPTAEQLGTIPCGYEFYAWSETSVNATQNKPALFMPGDTYTGSALTLYAVYRLCETGSNADLFSLSYTISGTKYYVGPVLDTKENRSTKFSAVTNENAATVFGMKSVEGQTYKSLFWVDSEENNKYMYWKDYGASFQFTSEEDDSYGWTVTGTTKLTFVSTPYMTKGSRYLSADASEIGCPSEPKAVTQFTKEMASTMICTYATEPECSTTATLQFVTNGGILNYPTTYDANSYQNLTPGSTVYLPTATFAGEWTFEGWMKDEPLTSQNLKPETVNFIEVELDITTYSASKTGTTTFYAVYSKTNDDKQFDPVNGGTYKLFAIGADDTKTYMPIWNGGRGTMSGVTTCAEAGDYTITPGTGTHAGQYQITCGEHTLGVVGDISQTDLNEVEGTWWNISESTSGKGTWRITVVGSSNRALSAFSNSFGNYALTQLNAAGQTQYRDMEIGECIYTEYTSTPENTPYITITGAPIKITSANGERVYASTTVHIEAHNFTGERIIHLSATNGFGVDPVQVRTNGQGAYSGNVKVYYEPTTDGDGQTITTSVLTASQTGETNAEKISQTFAAIQGRNMPANFVIAAKWDGLWYALPANCTTSNSSTEGVLIEVNDLDNPTIATAAPASAKYGLREVIPSRQTDHGQGIVFTERFAKDDKQFALYNGSNANIQVNAQYSNYAASNPDKYEWIPTTNDFNEYTLTNASTGRNLGLTSGSFGAYTAASNRVYLLPATFYEPAQMQVIKWKANSVIVMYTGAETTATTQVGDNAASATQTLADQQLTHGIYELTTKQALTSNAGGALKLNFGENTRVELEIPLIISGDVTASANAHDVVILENSKLTAAETKYSYKDVYVYGGAKLAIPTGTTLGVNNIILRAGSVATDGAGKNATYQYIYPQVELKGTLTSSVQNIRYEYVTDYDHWYHLVLPFDGSLASIHYPYEYYGDQVKLDNTGSWQIKRYAGEIRATGNYNAWVDIETEDKTSTTAGQGYIFWGAPKKITANDVYDRPTWGIQRITMSISAPAATTAENDNKTIAGLGSYATVEGNSGAANDQGWNLVGNPYMVNLNTMSEVGLKAGKLVEEKVDGNWTGKWINNGDNLRYLTIPSEHFDTYEAKTVSEAISANALVPGRAFFVQLDGEANGITFAADNRASLMPALLAENSDKPVDIETGIILSNETLQDEVNFWIKDGKTNDYEYNADYPKTPNNTNFNIYGVHTNGDLSWVAISPELAAESMPIGYQVPAAGTYMLSLSETYYSEDLESLYLTDHAMSPEVTVDLINAPYEFSVNQAETNNERFTISLKLKSENQGPTTGWENIDVGKDHPTKFIHQDRLYILRDGVIYDATGQEIQTINK